MRTSVFQDPARRPRRSAAEPDPEGSGGGGALRSNPRSHDTADRWQRITGQSLSEPHPLAAPGVVQRNRGPRDSKEARERIKGLSGLRAVMSQGPQGNLAAVNSGTINQVSKGNFRTVGKKGSSPEFQAFVKAPMRPGDRINESARLLGYDEDDEGRVIGDPRMVARAVASSRLDRLLGLDALAQEEFAHDSRGQYLGGASGGVAGHALMENLVEGRSEKLQRYNWIDAARPETQMSAANLQLLDFLTGQSDRHAGNIFIDPRSGLIRGIDNDQAFGDPANNPATKAHDMDFSRLPSQVDRQTAETILRLKSKHVAKILGGSKKDPERLNKAEIAAAVGRYDQLRSAILASQAAARSGGPAPLEIVDTWDQGTLHRARNKPVVAANEPDSSSYLGRHLAQYESAVTGTNRFSSDWMPAEPARRQGGRMVGGSVAGPSRDWKHAQPAELALMEARLNLKRRGAASSADREQRDRDFLRQVPRLARAERAQRQFEQLEAAAARFRDRLPAGPVDAGEIREDEW